jgi:hypothetical protein
LWNTYAIPDGDYEVRTIGGDVCGNTTALSRTYIVDNTPPIAVITSPDDCAMVSGLVTVRGTVIDTHLAGWVLQYSGGDAHGWVTIAAGNASVINGVLGTWDTQGLARCGYLLRLRATDTARLDCNAGGHISEYTQSANLGLSADLDGDGDVDLQDFTLFAGQWMTIH